MTVPLFLPEESGTQDFPCSCQGLQPTRGSWTEDAPRKHEDCCRKYCRLGCRQPTTYRLGESRRHRADRANKMAIADQGGKAQHEENPGLSRNQAIFNS